MLRLYTRFWEPRNAGPGKPRTWRTDPAVAQAVREARDALGLGQVPLPAPVVRGTGAEALAKRLVGVGADGWHGAPKPAVTPNGGASGTTSITSTGTSRA